MFQYRFHIVGLNYHDYRGRLEELYTTAVGNSMTLHIDSENVAEKNAVRAYMDSKFVGYVMTGHERDIAESILRINGLTVFGDVVFIDRKNAMISLIVKVKNEVTPSCHTDCNPLRKWSYGGELLRQTDEEIGLKAMLNNLQVRVNRGDAWDDRMERCRRFVCDNIWRDISGETERQLTEIIGRMEDCASSVEGYADALVMLRFTYKHIGSDECVRRQVANLVCQSHSAEVRDLIRYMGDSAEENVRSLPDFLVKAYDRDPAEYIGKVRYLRLPYMKLRQLQTLMAVRIALRQRKDGCAVCVSDVLTVDVSDKLATVVRLYYNNSPKNLALIYCVLRDRQLLVNQSDYMKFVEWLAERNLLGWMSGDRMRKLAYSIGQYMRGRTDHNKLREAFKPDFTQWSDGKEKALCLQIASLFD